MYEYKILMASPYDHINEEMLNNWAVDGWRYVGMIHGAITLERPKTGVVRD